MELQAGAFAINPSVWADIDGPAFRLPSRPRAANFRNRHREEDNNSSSATVVTGALLPVPESLPLAQPHNGGCPSGCEGSPASGIAAQA